jgi:hypothetical protein
MHIRCKSCGFIIRDTDHEHLKLLVDIKKWVNYVLSVHLSQGGTASGINKAVSCPPCPSCKSISQWENLTE